MASMINFISLWIGPVGYLIGFAPPLLASSWKSLQKSFAITMSLLLLTFAAMYALPGLLILLILLLLPIAAGSIAGHLTKAFLLYMRWRLPSWKAGLVVLIGILALPVIRSANAVYANNDAKADYAALPSASSLPQIAACDGFRTAGPLLTAELLPKPQANAVPSVPIRLMYPAAYMPNPPRYPLKDLQSSWIEFEMGVPGPRPILNEERVRPDGVLITPSKRTPSVAFHFAPRRPMPNFAWLNLRFYGGLRDDTDLPFELNLRQTTYAGLQQAQLTRTPGSPYDAAYIRMANNAIEAIVQCKLRADVPMCQFTFDEGGLPIDGYFQASLLSGWISIENDIRNFAKCSMEAGKMGRAAG